MSTGFFMDGVQDVIRKMLYDTLFLTHKLLMPLK